MQNNLKAVEKKESKIEPKKETVKPWLVGECSCTLVLPKDFAIEYGLDQASHVLIEKHEGGLFIRKLEV